MRAVVLSGGGAKGAYQIGVWKALKKLNIEFDIVTGTSIGALNGALMVQGSYIKALRLWNKTNFNMIFEEQLKHNFSTKEGKKELYDIYKEGIYTGGLKISNLEKTIASNLNVSKFFNSKIDYGMVTVNLSELKAVELTKNEIPKDKLKDYLIASATCFPFMEPKIIDGDKYIDGGYYDNFPISLAKKLGATEIIAVDLEALGFKKTSKFKNTKITHIRPKNKITPFLVFDKYEARKTISFGYNDTMKLYKKLDGDLFTFKLGELEKNFKKLNKKYIEVLENVTSMSDVSFIDKLIADTHYEKITEKKEKDFYKRFNENIEFLAKTFDMDEDKIYTANKINDYFFALIISTKTLTKKETEEKITNKQKLIKYFYELILENTEESKKEVCRLGFVFKKEFESAIYLSII